MNEPTTDPVLQRIAIANPLSSAAANIPLDDAAEGLMQAILHGSNSQRMASARRRRRRAMVGLGVAAAVALGGAAAAGGHIPRGVVHAFESVSPPGDTVRDAHMVIEHVDERGIRTQIWVGHNSSGGSCSYERTVSPDGRSEDGSVGCFDGPTGKPPPCGNPHACALERFAGGFGAAGRPYPGLTYTIVARTSVPAITRIVLVYPHRATYPLSFNPRNGWGVGVVPPSVTRLRSVLVGYDAAGHVVARERLGPTTLGRIAGR